MYCAVEKKNDKFLTFIEFFSNFYTFSTVECKDSNKITQECTGFLGDTKFIIQETSPHFLCDVNCELLLGSCLAELKATHADDENEKL